MNGSQYRVNVSGGGRTVTSAIFTLTVNPPVVAAPQIITPPSSVSVIAGQGSRFLVAASGTSLAYAWQTSTDNGFNWTPVAGATSAELALSTTSVADNGNQYRAVVSNSAGSVTSAAATLTVTALPIISAQPESVSVNLGQGTRFSVVASGTSLAYAWQTSSDGGTNWAAVAGATGAELVLTTTSLGDNGKRYRVVVSNGAGSVTSASATLTVTGIVAPTIIVPPQHSAAVAPGQSVSFSVTAGGGGLNYKWQVTQNNGGNWFDVPSATEATLTLSNVTLDMGGNLYRVVVSNALGSATSQAVRLTVAPLPIISGHPASQTLVAGQSVTLSVIANAANGDSLTYQWQLSTNTGANWSSVPGATANVLQLNDVQLGANGNQYRAVVSNSVGSVNSQVARLTVTAVPAPTIAAHPANQTVAPGQSVTLSVTANGTSLAYQWQRSTNNGANWSSVPGASSPALQLNDVQQSADGNQYRVEVSNAGGSVTSSAATITVRVGLPVITAQPQGSVVRIVGQTFTTTVGATGLSVSYAWETSPDGNPPWTTIDNATQATLTVPNTAIGDNGRRYRARVSNAGGTTTSNSAVLTVNWGEVVTSPDTSRLDVVAGGGADGGTAGGGDGDGADGGGGLGKVLSGRMTVTRTADGALVGTALTHPVTGLVKIKAGPGAGPFLVTLEGVPGARYFDEALNGYVDFGAGKVLHALVARIDENIGVTPLTEAAYRYALNNYLRNPVDIAAGRVPLASSGPATGLTAAQISVANATVLAEVNRMLPEGLKLVSLTSLPTPIDQSSSADSLRASRYGVAAAIVGGFVRASGQFQPSLTQPALAFTDQIALDLTDGVINGRALDGQSTVQAARTFDPARVPVSSMVGSNSVTQQFSLQTLFPLTPGIGELSIAGAWEYTFDGPAVTSACIGQSDEAALLPTGIVNVLRNARPIFNGCYTSPPSLIRDFDTVATNGRAIQVAGTWFQGFIVRENGSLGAWGSANCGFLGNGLIQGRFDRPTTIAGLNGVRAVATGPDFTLALTNRGEVYSWGASFFPHVLGLGLGESTSTAGFDVADCDPSRGVAPHSGGGVNAVTRPRRILALADIVNISTDGLGVFAVNSSGRAYMWGLGTYPASVPNPDRTVPNLIPDLNAVRAVTTARSGGPGSTVSFALQTTGTVLAWGANQRGNLGDGTTAARPNPVPLTGLANIREVVALNPESGPNLYNSSLLALRSDGTVFAWGGPVFGMTIRPLSAVVGAASVPGRIRHLWASGKEFVLFAESGQLFRLADGNVVLEPVSPESFQNLPAHLRTMVRPAGSR